MTSLLTTNGVVVEKIPNSWYRPHTIKMSSCVIGDKKIQYIARAHDRRNYHNIWLERMFKKYQYNDCLAVSKNCLLW